MNSQYEIKNVRDSDMSGGPEWLRNDYQAPAPPILKND
jgi:hypothetical protein